MIAIVNFGVSNVASVSNMIKKVGGESIIISKPDDLKRPEISKLIFPGVGSFDSAMSILSENRWIDPLNHFIEDQNNKLLGICLGMQLMFEKSEEGKCSGLGWIKGEIKKFKFKDSSLKTPHMGWNYIEINNSTKLFSINDEPQRYYFVHSYHAQCKEKNNTSSFCNYGYNFTSSVEKRNIFGVQFHPEKSHRYGMKLMKRFMELK